MFPRAEDNDTARLSKQPTSPNIASRSQPPAGTHNPTPPRNAGSPKTPRHKDEELEDWVPPFPPTTDANRRANCRAKARYCDELRRKRQEGQRARTDQPESPSNLGLPDVATPATPVASVRASPTPTQPSTPDGRTDLTREMRRKYVR